MKIFRVSIGMLFLLLLWSSLAFAQNVPGSRKDDIVIGSNGLPVPNPTIRVCLNTATGVPCSPLANVYSDPLLTQPLLNPFTGDVLSNYYFYASPGRYLIQISGTGIIGTLSFPDQLLPNDPLNPIFVSLLTQSWVGFFNLTATPSQPPPSGQTLLYIKTNNNVYTLNSAGVETCISCGGGGGGGSVTSVGFSGPGGIFSVSGSPITGSGVIGLTVAGTAQGLPYFSSTSTLSSGPSLTQNLLIKMGGTGPASSTVLDDGTNPTQTPNGLTVLNNGIYKQLPNAGTGTTVNLMVCETNSGTAATCAAAVTGGVSGVAGQGAGTTGNVQICVLGHCYVIFDNQTFIRDWAIPSTTNAGQLHDTGSPTATTGVQNFLVDSSNSGAGTLASIDLLGPDSIANSGGISGISGSGTPNTLSKFITANSIGNSLWTDTGSLATYSGTSGINIIAAAFSGTAPFFITGTEGSTGSCPSISASVDILCWSSNFHALALSNNGGTYLQVAQLPIPSAGLVTVSRYRICQMIIGSDDGASALANADLGPQGRQCYVPYGATIVEVMVAADNGTPNVVPAKNHAGTRTDILSAVLTTAASGGLACANGSGTLGLDGATTCSGTLSTTALLAGDWLELDTGATAGGTAKRMSISITYSVN